jgi:peptide/nickel transport system ATP-binding protein
MAPAQDPERSRPVPRSSGGVSPDPLVIEGLYSEFNTSRGVVHAVNGVNLRVGSLDLLGLVGETGSGKSVTISSILRLIQPPGRVVAGRALFEGIDLLTLPEQALNKLRGGDIALIPQNAKAALNPLLTVERQMRSIFEAHLKMDPGEMGQHIGAMLDAVGLRDRDRVRKSYPHQLSGGMAQRILVAIAFGTRPRLLIADEPTTGLDPTIQLRVLDLLVRVINDVQASALIITHDLRIVARYCKRIGVMHAGTVVESGPVAAFFKAPRHPYSLALLSTLSSSPLFDKIRVIGGPVDLVRLPTGCAYHPRCQFATAICREVDPPLRELDSGISVKCHHSEEVVKIAAGWRAGS